MKVNKMNELKTIDKIIQVSESKCKLDILDLCMSLQNYDTYNNFFESVHIYQDAGFNIKYLFNVNTQEYYFEPIEKIIGFRK